MTGPRGRPIRELGEDRMVARFRKLAGGALGSGVVAGPGDDAAALRLTEDRLLLFTCDMMVEGVHFRREWATPEQIGWKAMTQNLSDIAAMGGEPGFAVASVAVAGEVEEEVVEGIGRGLAAAAARYGGALVGGDLVGSPGPLVVDVAATGWVEEDLMLRRRGARPGDSVAVTGALGAAGAGLAARQRGLAEDGSEEVKRALQAHHEPRPRLAEGRVIASTRRASAMMDVSDGLAEDLPRLCAESGVGVRINAGGVPIDPSCAAVAARLGLEALELATSGGEDYELLFTCAPEAVEEIAAAVAGAAKTPVTVIGEVLAESGVMMVDEEGRPLPLRSGFDHFARQSGRG